MTDTTMVTLVTGNYPAVSGDRLRSLRGHFCAVEFNTRELLGHGETWEDALEMVNASGFSDRQFYRYKVPENYEIVVEEADIEAINAASSL